MIVYEAKKYCVSWIINLIYYKFYLYFEKNIILISQFIILLRK